MPRLLLAPLALASLACSAATLPGPAIPGTCNGAEALCDRRFDQVAYPTTHNAMSTTEAGWGLPNQIHGMPRQLTDGVRGMMLDLHEWEGEVHLCHGICQIGSRPLRDGLGEIKAFLDAHRGEVIGLCLESYVDAARVKAVFEQSGLLRYAHAHPKDAPWPTLRELIARDQRLVVFTDKDGGAFPWYHDAWQHAWQNPYAAATPADLSCRVDRGAKDNPVFIMNHFLTGAGGATQMQAEEINHDPFFTARALRCQAESGKLPNFVTVNYYEIGDLFRVVRVLNGLDPEPPIL
ncbi:MAG: hypothetical protein EXR72_26495, partial [Myxococcales bacterium]|nr:hypothetical protein [Myxococcales bacterium]